MLMNMESLLQTARKYHFAAGAFNVCDSLLFSTAMECIEEQHAPVIVELAPPEFSYIGSDFFAHAVKWIQSSSVPCVLHLNHGKTIQNCTRVIHCGFISVMIGGSLLTYGDSVKLTKTAVELARGVDVSVEREIRTIGALSDSVERGVEQTTYTKLEEVTDFLTRTNADTLAVAIGIIYGIYPKGLMPRLRLDILKAVERVNTRPFVLYGGSVNRDEEIIEACRHGICGANTASGVHRTSFQGIKGILMETDAS